MVNIDSFLQKCGYTVGIRAKNVLMPKTQEDTGCATPLWLSGGSLPLLSHNNRRLVHFIDGLRGGIEFVIFRGIHLGITALAAYQLYEWLHQPTSLICHADTDTKHNLLGLIDFYKSSDDNVLLSVFHDVFSPSSSALSYLKYALLTPFVFGLGKGGSNTRNSRMTTEEITAKLEAIQKVSPSFYNDFLRWLLPLPPINQATGNLMKNLLWNGDLESDDLQRVVDTFATLATSGRFYTSIHALGYLAPIMYGSSLNDLSKMSQRKAPPKRGLLEEDLTERLVPDEEMKEINSLQAEGGQREEQREADQEFAGRIHKRLELKAKALATLEKTASFHNQDGKRKSMANIGISLYAQYLLWSLGAPRSWPETVGQSLFKGSKFYAQIKFLQTIIDALLKAEQCPQQPGVTLAGVEPWATDLTQTCFNAYAQLFNIIPGQPTETLVENLKQYYFPNCTVSLDLSNKALSWGTIYNITKAFLDHNITIRALNLSGLGINTEEAFKEILPTLSGIEVLDLSNNDIGLDDNVDASGTMTLGNELRALRTLTFLDLSYNRIGNHDDVNASGTVALGNGLHALRALTSLDLSNNVIGSNDYPDASGTVALGEGIGVLKTLTSLNLSENLIGYWDADNASGTVTLGERINALRALTSLDFSTNLIGYGDDGNASGTMALGEGIGTLRALTFLDLSGNAIGKYDDYNASGTVMLGEGISALRALTSLDLSSNEHIGSNDNIDASGTVALGEGIRTLRALISLDLSGNAIGKWDNNDTSGTVALAEGIGTLRALTSLDLSGNAIGCNHSGNGVDSFIESIAVLNKLKSFYFMPQKNESSGFFCVSETILQRLNAALNHTQVPPLVALIFPKDVEVYCETLPFSVQIVNLSNILYYSQALAIRALMMCLKNKPMLTSLYLSNNNIGGNDDVDISGTVALGEGISTLKTLTFLDLSRNGIGYNDNNDASGTVALGEGIGALKALAFLDLSNNYIGYNDNNDTSGTVALGEGIGELGSLIALDLSGNWISKYDDYNTSGTLALGKGISALRVLTSLDLSHNAIGYNDNTNASSTVALGEGIGGLKALTSLDLSRNGIGLGDDGNASGTVALGEGIGALKALIFLNLSDNAIGEWDKYDASGTMALGEGIGALSGLENLNLAGYYLSWTPSIVTLANALNSTRNLVFLNLGGNQIGSMGPEGPAALLKVLPSLPDLDLSQLDLSGMTNVSWTSSADVLQQLHSKELMAACQNSRCFGGGVASSTNGGLAAKLDAISLHNEALTSKHDTASSFQVRQALALSEPEYSFPSQTSGVSSPFSFLREVRQGFTKAYQAWQEVVAHPDVQMMSYVFVATKLTAYAAVQALPFLVVYAAIAP